MDRIVVGVDGSQAADRALRWAVAEAARHGALVDLVHAYVLHPYAGMFGEADRELARGRLDEVVERNRTVLDAVKWSATLTAASGAAAAALVDAAADADLAVVGSRGRGGFPRLTLGSTSYRVAAHAQVPVAVVPAASRGDDGRRPVLVGIDDAPASRRALRWAVEEAARRGTGLTAVHAYTLPADPAPQAALNQRLYDDVRVRAHAHARALVDRVVDDTQNPAGVHIRREVAVGPAAGVLLDRAVDHLLVVGTRGQGTFSRAVFGSVSQQVLHHTDDPVVVVP
ncbi:MAG TPA: universal stress protein [Euzebyales bacterium]